MNELEVQSRVGNKNARIALGTFDVEEINKKIHRYYRYVGSLTTPPCTEGVIWNIIGKVIINLKYARHCLYGSFTGAVFVKRVESLNLEMQNLSF